MRLSEVLHFIQVLVTFSEIFWQEHERIFCASGCLDLGIILQQTCIIEESDTVVGLGLRVEVLYHSEWSSRSDHRNFIVF